MKVKENVYTCKTCIYREFWCLTDDNGTCNEWEGPDPDEPDLPEDEQRANAGCDEAHRIMVEGREIG